MNLLYNLQINTREKPKTSSSHVFNVRKFRCLHNYGFIKSQCEKSDCFDDSTVIMKPPL